MMHSWTLATALLLVGCVLAETAYQIGFKIVAGRADPNRLLPSVAGQPLLWAVIALWAIEVVAWIAVLRQAPLANAFPLMCLTYATVPLAGILLLKETLSRRQSAGVILIFVGVTAVCFSGAQGGAL